MSQYKETQIIPVASQIAWQALKAMNLWLPTLSTNKAVIYDNTTEFFVEGRQYTVETKEGVEMKSQLYKIDADNLQVEIHAKWFILHSYLTCQVKPVNDTTCEIIRTQGYPGVVGKLFTSFFNKREAGETGEYLQVWTQYASKLANK